MHDPTTHHPAVLIGRKIEERTGLRRWRMAHFAGVSLRTMDRFLDGTLPVRAQALRALIRFCEANAEITDASQIRIVT